MPVVDSRPPVAGEPLDGATVPSPRIPLPPASLPTLALFAGGLAAWGTATWLLLAGPAPWWVTIPVHALVTFTMFTVAHESAHHAAGKLTWLNEVLGRLAMLFVAAYGSFPFLRFIHIEHHRNTNADAAKDPDAWTSQGPWWQLPFRWLTIDLWYVRFYARHVHGRPRPERAETLVTLTAFAAMVVTVAACGHGWELLAVYLIPQRLGLALLAWWFDWLPHHGLGENRFGATRVRVGLEWLMTPVMLYQNYHLVHHLHPAIPFYRYLRAWNDNRDAYLAREVAITTAWGRELTPAEYRTWRRLTGCFEEPPAPAPEPRGLRRFHSLRVAAVQPVAQDAVAITFDVPPELRETFRHVPGQHVVIRTAVGGSAVRRTYSICSPAGADSLRIAVKRRDGGTFSPYATTQLKPGDELDLLPPSGGFTLAPEPRRSAHYVALAAGSGITPVLSILSSALRDEPHSRATLLYVNTSGATTMFADEISALAGEWAGRLHVVHFRTDERDPDLHAHRPVRHFDTVGEALAISHERYRNGRLDGTRLRALLQNRLHPAKVDQWFLCGPRGLLEMARRTLAEAYVPDEDVSFELFAGAPARGRTGASAALAVTVGRSVTDVVTSPGETVLDASLRAGLDVPYSCTGGACGACVAKLTRGRVDMDVQYALTEADVAEHRILTCRARPTTPEVAVDYDR
ncbi:fatty acid desaturase [Amycolatopsis sp. FDAARGOS 1241]|uniref:fatty acid desaturase n=1 Tax=Amycolatopsis sp. FDAARGOS 1241 TaxID=2778070 RepID=UPI00194F2777|nr:fatty acid desaturase [Amycolatopsis sp. FDAARGOS 1241]QRP48290.1 fatty acid desaturase [Amycolatopsis sp. FDAARGOS 1241]